MDPAGSGAARLGSLTEETNMTDKTPSELIDARIEELGDWRGETLARIRALVKEADPEVQLANAVSVFDAAFHRVSNQF